MSSYRVGGVLGFLAFALAAAGHLPQTQRVRQQKPKNWDESDENEAERNRRHLQRRQERRNKRQTR